MHIKGFKIITNSNNFELIRNRIQEMGEDYYKYRKLFPIYIMQTDRENSFCFSTKESIEPMFLLGFSFEGLIDDSDKIKEIEKFGAYRCVIEKIGEDVLEKNIKEFIF